MRALETGDAAEPAGVWHGERVTLGRHFLRDLEGLWGGVLKLAAVVEEALNRSVTAVCDGRLDLADEVCLGDPVVDRWEARIEREFLKVLALHQPVASDLRRVAAVLKISGDLERLGDLARHMAKRARKLADHPLGAPLPTLLEGLAVEALALVRDGLYALTQSDTTLARAVIAGDRRIDCQYRSVLKSLKHSIKEQPDWVDHWLRLINTARNLERVADHAVNIAETVIYLKEGEIIRHVVPIHAADAGDSAED